MGSHPHMTRRRLIERITNALPDNYLRRFSLPSTLRNGLSRLAPSDYVAGMGAVVLLFFIATDPVSAQQYCSDGLDATLNAGIGIIFGYGRPLIIAIAFIGVIAVMTEPAFQGQRVAGYAILASVVIGLAGFMLVTEFTNTAFNNMGAPQGCIETLNSGGNSTE